jgi:predicted amidophosphoribosyltransferase
MDTFIASQWIDGANQVVGRMTLCKHCGYNASDESIYCIMCGKKLSVAEELHGGVIFNLKNMLRGHTADEEVMV